MAKIDPFESFVILFVVLATVVALGAVLAYVGVALSRWFSRSGASVADVDRAIALRAPAPRPAREPFQLGPNAEPFILATLGFIIVFILALLFVTVPPHASSEGKGSAPSALVHEA
ncbi:MAG: hypothetical protein K1X39_07165 [Thermoflexales bacterium]|nr:hypothetical protein [Thermoflexales bacterium]